MLAVDVSETTIEAVADKEISMQGWERFIFMHGSTIVSVTDLTHPKERRMELTNYQFLYIQTMYDYFTENLQWPTFRQVEKKILPIHKDFRVLEVARSLEDNQAVHIFYHHLDVQATITLQEIRHYPAAEQDLADLVKVIRYCAEKYINSNEDEVIVTGVEVGRNLHLDETAVRKVGLLLVMASGIFTSFSNPEEPIWQLYASQDVLYFEGIHSIDDYFEKLEERNKSYGMGQVAQKVDTLITQYSDPAPIIEQIAQTDPTNIQATIANLMKIDNSYYINALEQSQRSFFWALVGAGVGIAFFIIAVFILIFRQPISQSYLAAIITASSGGVVEIIAGIILTLHSRASDQVNLCHVRLNRLQRFLVAISHCENLEGDLKHTTRAELIKKLADLQ